MPVLLKLLGLVGTAAMLWVGGGILLHGLEGYGVTAPGHVLHDAAAVAAGILPALGGAIAWLVTAVGSAVVGLLVGAALIPVVEHGIAPLARAAMAGEGRGGARRLSVAWRAHSARCAQWRSGRRAALSAAGSRPPAPPR